jgi:hypothetical protein
LLKPSFMERVKAVTALGGLSSFPCRSRAAICTVYSTGFEIVEIGVTLVSYFEVSNENHTTNINTVLCTTTTTTIIIIIIIIQT